MNQIRIFNMGVTLIILFLIEAFSKIHLPNPDKFVNPYIIGIFENRLDEEH